MITLITGAPGAGKTAALVSLLEEIGKDRAIYVHGIPDLSIAHVALDDPAQWPESVPDGSIIVIDEVQTVWRPSGAGQKIPDHIQKLETHRHRGLDFYIITQGPNLVHSNVRSLVGRHVHLRDVGFLGRRWYEWPETCDNCRTGWKTAPIRKKYRLPKKVFGKYKSASVHIKPVRSFPVVVLVLAVAVLGLSVLGWQSYKSIQAKMLAGKNPVSAHSPLAVQSATATPSASVQSPDGAVFIDDRIAFIPRISSRPETAPAYDQIRQIAVMPLVVGGVCMKGKCLCVTQQGTDAGLSDRECSDAIAKPRFDPYTVKIAAAGSPSVNTLSAPAETASAPAPSAVSIPMPSGVQNPGADAKQPLILPPGSPVQPTIAKDEWRPSAPTLQSSYRRS